MIPTKEEYEEAQNIVWNYEEEMKTMKYVLLLKIGIKLILH